MTLNEEIGLAIEELSKKFLGRLGIVSISDDYENGEPTLLVSVNGEAGPAQSALPSDFRGFPVKVVLSGRLIAY